MLAFVGMIFTDAYTLPGYEFSTLEAHDAGVANGSMSQLLLWLGLLELFSFIGIDQMLRGSGREPGDYGALARSHACAMEPRHLAVRPRGCSCLQIGEAPPLSTGPPTRGMRAPVHESPERATNPPLAPTASSIARCPATGFDPIGFISDPKKKEEMQMKELANGRLAMFAFGGAVTQAVLTGNSFPWFYSQ